MFSVLGRNRRPIVSPGRRASILLAFLLAGVYVAECLWFVGTQSLTYDEPTHILAGLDAWRNGRFEQWNDQPPLARLLLAAPVLGRSWQLEPLAKPLSGAFWTITIRPSPEELAWHTRPVSVALGLALALLLWMATRHIFSESAATVALALFVFSPPLVAHFSLATVDGSAALFLFAAASALIGWRRRPSWAATMVVGAALGGLLISKFSTPPLVALALAIMLASRAAGERWFERLGKAGAALGVALFVLWSAYFFHTGMVTFRNGSLSGPYASSGTVIVPTSTPLNLTVPLPAPEYVSALGGVIQHGVRGQPAFFLGEVKTRGGWRAYFPVVAALKWPLIVFLLAGATALALVRRPHPRGREVAILILFPAVFFALATISNLDIGERHILPVYPFLLLLAGGAIDAIGPLRTRTSWIVLIVAIQATDSVRYAPDYLSYFNVFVRPDRSFELLSDSNLDWGQGLIALRNYQRAHPGPPLKLAYFGSVDPAQYGVRAEPLAEPERATGTVVVSATHLSGQYLEHPSAYRWLLQYPRAAILNHSLYVFSVPAGAAK